MFTGYAACYPTEDFEIVEVEKTFTGEIRNPDTGRPSQTFVMAGKADAIVQRPDGHVPAGAQDRRQHRCQLPRQAVDRHADRPLLLLPAAARLSDRRRDLQRAAQVPPEAEGRARRKPSTRRGARNWPPRTRAASRPPSGRLPESDEEFQARLAEWYARPEAFHREHIYLSEDRLAMLQEEVWEITQQYLDARRRGKWLLNTSNCFSYQRPCEYLPYCQSGFNPNVADNLYEIAPPHEELNPADSDAPLF